MITGSKDLQGGEAMKCPMLATGWSAAKGGDKVYGPDCLKEECAVWMSDFEMCSINYAAIELGRIKSEIHSVAKELTLIRTR